MTSRQLYPQSSSELSDLSKAMPQENVIYKYIMDTYQKVSGIPPERKHVRIKINPNDRIGIKFRSPVNSQFIIGQIKDISFGGIAVELAGHFPEDSIAIGLEIKNLQFILEGKEIFIDGIVVAYQKKFCAFLFEGMNKEIREIISQYIFEKTYSEGEENKVGQEGTGSS